MKKAGAPSIVVVVVLLAVAVIRNPAAGKSPSDWGYLRQDFGRCHGSPSCRWSSLNAGERLGSIRKFFDVVLRFSYRLSRVSQLCWLNERWAEDITTSRRSCRPVRIPRVASSRLRPNHASRPSHVPSSCKKKYSRSSNRNLRRLDRYDTMIVFFLGVIRRLRNSRSSRTELLFAGRSKIILSA